MDLYQLLSKDCNLQIIDILSSWPSKNKLDTLHSRGLVMEFPFKQSGTLKLPLKLLDDPKSLKTRAPSLILNDDHSCQNYWQVFKLGGIGGGGGEIGFS